VPELPEVEEVRRELEPAMAGSQFERVVLRRKNLRRPFPRGFAARLTGQAVRELRRRGKYLVAGLSSGESLLMHLGMSGWFRVERDGSAQTQALRQSSGQANPHDHVVFHMSSGAAVVFNDPRRFGVMDLLSPARLARHAALGRMGPEPLGAEFDGAALARACAGRRTSLKAALLDQRVVAGLGNIYASEALHLAGLSPKRRASTIATRDAQPKESAHRLARAIKEVLRRAIARSERPAARGSRFRVYDREGERCRRCGGSIQRCAQSGRSTFYCPHCQG
jgi:formamidopyrimidine-DNA glycosylase